jgi:PIN domain nuclease of toxin-antitoxin system
MGLVGFDRGSLARYRRPCHLRPDGPAISIISCWEVAKLVELGRLELRRPLEEWLALALRAPRLALLPLTPPIVVESTRLPGSFHRDPADQLIVATARMHGVRLLTADRRILNYPHLDTIAL